MTDLRKPKKRIALFCMLVFIAAVFLLQGHEKIQAKTVGFVFIFFALVVLFPLSINQAKPQEVRVTRTVDLRGPPSK